MITVVAVREKGWYDNKRTEYRLYDQTCRAYGVDLKMIDNINEIDAKNIVIFDENGDISLENFKHPDDAIYLFGRTGLDLKHDFPDKQSVRINTDSSIALFGAVACGIVLEDRRRKNVSHDNK